jgi:hypothetical protein
MIHRRRLLSERWYRPLMVGLTTVLGLFAVALLVDLARSSFGRDWSFGNGDLVGYLAGARRFLDTGSPYLREQLSGTWRLEPHSFIHPPSALPLFIPFLVLPAILWWAIPLAITVAAIWQLRPAPWAWPLIALCLCWPRSTGSLLAGNTDIWAMGFLAGGAVLGWPAALVAIKPTFGPFALVGARHRSWWLVVALIAAGSLLVLPLWFEWLRAIANVEGGLGPDYSLLNLPLPSIPIIAWAARTRDRGRSMAPAGERLKEPRTA